MFLNETYPEPTQSTYSTAGLVLLVRRLRTGDTVSEWVTLLHAMDELMFGLLNGREVVSGHVETGEVSLGTSGVSGGGFAAEYSAIIPNWDKTY